MPTEDSKNPRSVHLDFPCRHCKAQKNGTFLPSTTSDWDCLPLLLRNVLPQLLQDVDLRLWFINGAYTTFSCSCGILERVSGTTHRTRWANSMACSFSRFQSTRFLFFTSGDIWSPLMLQALTTSRACNNKYRMHYRRLIRRLPFSSDSRCHCSRRATSCVGGQGWQFEHFLQFSGKHKSETMLQESYVHITHFSCIVLIRLM